jgi:TolB protein
VGAAIVAVAVAVSAAGGLPQPVTGRGFSSVHSFDPEWSPDGTKIAFIDQPGTIGTLYVMNAAGGAVRQVTDGQFDARWPSWSPDGRSIAFEHTIATASGASSEIDVVNVDGSGLRRVVSDGAEPAWGPGGKKIAFTRPGPLGNERIHIVSPDGTGVQLVADPHDECEAYVEPTWSPDGEYVAFAATGVGGECGFRVFIGASRGYGAKVRVLAGGWYEQPDWSPDGKRIALVRYPPAGGDPYYTVGIFDLRKSRLVGSLRAGWHPRWSPDGRSLVFVRGEPFGANAWSRIYAMDADGSNLRQLTP